MSLLAVTASLIASGVTLPCTPTHVWDGDGPVWCAEGPKIRLAGIATREIDESCKPGYPCPPSSGIKARDYLVRLLGVPTGVAASGHIKIKGPVVRCRSGGSGRGDRTAAWCRTARGVDINCAMVASGFALRWGRYDPQGRCRR